MKEWISCTEKRIRYREQWPEKVLAHWAVRDGLYHGDFVRPDSCSRCGKSCSPQAHHEDYDKPYEIVWLCRSCHLLRHGELKTAGWKWANSFRAKAGGAR